MKIWTMFHNPIPQLVERMIGMVDVLTHSGMTRKNGDLAIRSRYIDNKIVLRSSNNINRSYLYG